jgi:outer membrane protein assembly factor BamD
MRKVFIPLFVLALFLLSACSSNKAVPAEKNAGFYFQEGEEFYEKGLYKDAIASWEKVRDSYYSPELNILAELKIADAHFYDEEYIEAAVAYEAFLQNHPNHPRVPDVLYQVGLAYTYQILAPDQDQTSTVYALNAFRTLKERFPEDRRIAEVQIYIDRCRNMLASRDLIVANYYLRTGYYTASINRIEGLLAEYPEYYESDKAYYMLGQAYSFIGDNEKSLTAFNTLFDEYTGSEYIPDARKFIEENL